MADSGDNSRACDRHQWNLPLNCGVLKLTMRAWLRALVSLLGVVSVCCGPTVTPIAVDSPTTGSPTAVGSPTAGAAAQGCGAQDAQGLVEQFIANFNAGDVAGVDRLVAPPKTFQWYSTDGPGERLDPQARNRTSLLEYVAVRHTQHKRLELRRIQFNGVTGAFGNFEFDLIRTADDLLPTAYSGKGAIDCTSRPPTLAVWSMSHTAASATAAVLYAGSSADADFPGGIEALALPSGQRLGSFSDVRRQGGGFAIAPGGRFGYLLDGPFLHQLELPALRSLREAQIDGAIPILGTGQVLAVAPDGAEVYVETMRIIGPQRWDDRLRTGRPESVYGVGVYDVATGALARRFDFGPPWCGVAELFTLPDQHLLVFCQTAQDVRLVNPLAGREIGRIGLGDPPLYGNAPGRAVASILSPDGKHLYLVRDSGGLVELDVASHTLTRGVVLGGDGSQRVPYQRLHLLQDGAKLFVRVAMYQADLRGRGLGDVVWIVDTTTLKRTGEIRLPVPAFDTAPTPDGRLLVTSNTNTQLATEQGTRLIDIQSGAELAHWPASLCCIHTSPLPG